MSVLLVAKMVFLKSSSAFTNTSQAFVDLGFCPICSSFDFTLLIMSSFYFLHSSKAANCNDNERSSKDRVSFFLCLIISLIALILIRNRFSFLVVRIVSTASSKYSIILPITGTFSANFLT